LAGADQIKSPTWAYAKIASCSRFARAFLQSANPKPVPTRCCPNLFDLVR